MNTQIIIQPNNDKIWGISIDALLSAFIAIFVFVVGFLLNKIYENYKEKKRLLGIESFFWTVVDSFLEPINYQLKIYREIATKINDKFQKDFIYFENPYLNIPIYKTINPTDLHKIFLSKKNYSLKDRMQHFNTIIKSLDYIESQKISLKDNFMQFFREFRIYEKDWQTNIAAIMNYYESFLSHNKSKGIHPSQDAFLKKMDSLQFTCSTKEKFPDPSVVYEYLIKELLLLCKQFQEDSRVNLLKPYLIGAEYAYNNMANVRNIFYNLFSNEAAGLEKEFIVLKKSINILKND